ncbi:hypothetical protein HCH_04066 [Hahella chejuensis KCTC 2396]|uniref:Uncharacterized protein n=1 Tax=Hahella chejuensis (strain KCTC 2396) TaxID=349521 RepID=Q2SEZ6_HAHCH|nr:hypothetical protein HCH_04066 [Hahella chejuensis KCTC 2396]
MTPEILRLTFLTHKKAADGRLCACRQRPKPKIETNRGAENCAKLQYLCPSVQSNIIV